MSGPAPDKADRLFEEAAAWFARMRGPGAKESRAQFEAWLSLGALHRAAYNRAAEVFALGKLLADQGSAKTSAFKRSRRRPAEAAAVAAALLLLVSSGWVISSGRSPEPGHSSSSIGARSGQSGQVLRIAALRGPRSERLADGSMIRLQGHSSIEVELSRAARTLTLERGSARFFVAHEQRPFLVLAGGGYVAARGTVFDVALGSDHRVTVRLLKGIVDVSPPMGEGPMTSLPRRLRAGESMSFASLSSLLEPEPAALNQGQIEPWQAANSSRMFDSISLADLVALANRGVGPLIRIADPATGRLLVSGSFRIDDRQVLAERLAALLDLEADRRSSGEILLEPKRSREFFLSAHPVVRKVQRQSH
jgi:transmembrane sensor